MHHPHDSFPQPPQSTRLPHTVTIRSRPPTTLGSPPPGSRSAWASALQCHAAGEVLFRQGDSGDEMYVIRRGAVELHRRIDECDYLVGILGHGEFFGELALINHQPRSTTAIVCSDAELIAVGPSAFADMVRELPDFAARIIKGLAGRLAVASQQAEALLPGHARRRVVKCLIARAEMQIQRGARRGSAVYVPVTLRDLSEEAMLPRQHVLDVIAELASVGLVVQASLASIDGPGYVIAEAELLDDYVQERTRRAVTSDTLWIR